LCVGFHSLGMLLPSHHGWTCVGSNRVWDRRSISFSGVPVLRSESLFLGVGG